MTGTLLVLGASRHQLDVIAAARRLGARVVTADDDPVNPGHALADAAHVASTTDFGAIDAVAAAERIDGVLAFATDVALPIAARVAADRGLSGPSPAAVGVLCHKARFRELQHRHGFAHPEFEVLDGDATPPELPWGGAFVVKPTRASGSKGIRRVAEASELAPALAAAREAGLDRETIVERALDGRQGTCEGWFDGARVSFHLLLDRQTVAPPYVATRGHRLPTTLSREVEGALLAELERLFGLLELAPTPFDCDFVATAGGVVLLEATPRVGGNSIVRLVRRAAGIDLAELAVRSALGERLVVGPPARLEPAAIVLFGAPRAGRLAWDAAGLERLRREPWLESLELDLPAGASVGRFRSGRDVVGRALLVAADRGELDARADRVERELAVDAEAPAEADPEDTRA